MISLARLPDMVGASSRTGSSRRGMAAVAILVMHAAVFSFLQSSVRHEEDMAPPEHIDLVFRTHSPEHLPLQEVTPVTAPSRKPAPRIVTAEASKDTVTRVSFAPADSALPAEEPVQVRSFDMENGRQIARAYARAHQAQGEGVSVHMTEAGDSAYAKAIKKAERSDCRTKYAAAELLALVPIVMDTVRGKGCKW